MKFNIIRHICARNDQTDYFTIPITDYAIASFEYLHDALIWVFHNRLFDTTIMKGKKIVLFVPEIGPLVDIYKFHHSYVRKEIF